MSWMSRGLRGSSLEEMINITNDVYKQKKLAIIQKIPTPITPVKLSPDGKNILLAYFDKQSTVDYIGVVQGIPLCFDAKQTTKKSFPLNNVHPHQIEFMDNFQNQQGIAFALVYFKTYDEYYYLPFNKLKQYFDAAKNGARKSIPYEAFDKRLQIKRSSGYIVHYLDALNTYLQIMKEG